MAATQNPLEAFIWGAGGSKKTPEEIARDKEIAAELLMKAGNTSPVEHWTQGAARVADALSGVIKQKRAERAGVENETYNQGILSELFKGSSAQPAATPSASATIPASGASAEMAATSPNMQSYRDAIAGIESAGSGDYAAIGPTNEKLGRALGRYQIMEANIGPWSQAALGRAVTPDEFMADPKLQDTIFDHQFGQYVQKYGPEGAAQAWLGGEGGVGQVGRKDVLGTSIGEYGNRFTSALGGSPQAAIEAVSPTQGGSLTDEVAAFEQTPAYSAQFPGQEPAQQPAMPAQQPTAVQQVAQALPVAGQAQQAVPGMSEALLRAISDPRATPQTRAVVQALMQQEQAKQAQAAEQQQWMARQAYEQQQRASDPATQLDMDYKRAQLEALKGKGETLINAGDGRLYNPQTKEWIQAPGASGKAPTVVELFDETTGQPYKATWNAEKNSYERVGGVKARSGMQLTTNPDGTVSLTQGAIDGMPKLTEAEGRNSGFYGRGVESQKTLNTLEAEGKSLWNKTVGSLPIAGNYALSEDGQKYDQARRDFINAVLRRESGAVISPEEFANAEKQYFPQPGDGDKVVEQKRRNRDTTIQGLKISSGQGAAFAVPADKPKAEPDFSTMSDEELERLINGG